jgi:TolA-binding protein
VEAAPPRATEPPAPTETPARVFQAAERARRSGDATEADRLYGQLATDFPRSREEIAARALHGQLLLDELGRAEEALAWFDAYLRAAPRGALAEEARAGRAEAFGRLARRDEEAAAWSDLLASHPGSLHGARARARLAALVGE